MRALIHPLNNKISLAFPNGKNVTRLLFTARRATALQIYTVSPEFSDWLPC